MSYSFSSYHNLRQLSQHIENIYHHHSQHLLLPFSFLSNQESQYMIQIFSYLSYEKYNSTIQHNQIQIPYLLKKELKRFLIISLVLEPIIISELSDLL